MKISSVPLSRILRSVDGLQRLLALFCVLLFFAQAEKGQSGRAPKRDLPSPPVSLPSQPASTENPAKPSETKSPQPISSLVIVNSVNSAKAPVWTSLALRELIDQIKASPKVSVAREKDMSRKDAGELAKIKTDVHVIWIEFGVDASMAMINREAEATIVNGLNPACLFISYVIFPPGTTIINTQAPIYPDY